MIDNGVATNISTEENHQHGSSGPASSEAISHQTSGMGMPGPTSTATIPPGAVPTIPPATTDLETAGPDSPSQTPHNQSPTITSYPEGGLQAWLVVFGSFSGMVSCFGMMNTIGVFQAYLSTHQLRQHSPGVIGWIFSVYVFLSFFCGIQIGPLFDAHGPRALVLAGSVCILLSQFLLALCTGLFIPSLLLLTSSAVISCYPLPPVLLSIICPSFHNPSYNFLVYPAIFSYESKRQKTKSLMIV